MNHWTNDVAQNPARLLVKRLTNPQSDGNIRE